MTEAELLGCPNPWCCQSLPVIRWGRDDLDSERVQVVCRNCEIAGPFAYNEAAASREWNTRAKPTPVPGTDAVEVTQEDARLAAIIEDQRAKWAAAIQPIIDAKNDRIQSLSTRTEELVKALEGAIQSLEWWQRNEPNSFGNIEATRLENARAALASHRGEG